MPMSERVWLLQNGTVSMLTCPICGEEQDPSGPGVSSHRDGISGEWLSSWTPFIEDLRGTPQPLVHPRCFVEESGFGALVTLVTEHDRRVRLELSKHC
jgi:hypothetical protein